MHFEIFKGKDRQWYARIIEENGRESFRTTDGYRNKVDVVKACHRLHGLFKTPVVKLVKA